MSRDLRESTKKQRDQKFRSGVDLHKAGKDSNNKGDKKDIIQEVSAVENLTRDEEEPIQKVSEVSQIKEISVIESEDTEIQYQPSGAGGTRSPPATPHRPQS